MAEDTAEILAAIGSVKSDMTEKIDGVKDTLMKRMDHVKTELYGAIEKRDDRCRTTS